jgi:hypothetical protein
VQFTGRTVPVTGDAAEVCPVTGTGVLVKNTGPVTVLLGGPDLDGSEGNSRGFPLEPGESQSVTGAAAKESALVPAPSGDLRPASLHARTVPGAAGDGRVSWLAAG